MWGVPQGSGGGPAEAIMMRFSIWCLVGPVVFVGMFCVKNDVSVK